MISYSELKPGTTFILDGNPYVVLEYNFSRMQQNKPVAQTKIKNLRNGKILSKTFHQSESFKEAIIEKNEAVYLYNHRGQYWFSENGNPRSRFSLDEELLGNKANFLADNTAVVVHIFKDNIINVEIPIKVDLKVVVSPPGTKGNTAQGGTKEVVLETGYKVNVPLFVNENDIIRINTESGLYAERVEKA